MVIAGEHQWELIGDENLRHVDEQCLLEACQVADADGAKVDLTEKQGKVHRVDLRATSISATINSLRECTAKPLSQNEFEVVIAFNMIGLVKIRPVRLVGPPITRRFFPV
jgi:hypothetical protein